MLAEPAMEKVRAILSSRLYTKGLTPIEIKRLLIDVNNIIGDGGNFTVASINQKLEHLGWEGQMIDESCFELIIFLLENKDQYDYE